jgi:prepilin-type N-terminal cleavage/methylation domain-containing protein
MNLNRHRKAGSRSKVSKGFSLVELIISISILGIVTTILLTKNSEFNGNILLTNLAYDVALSIRESQVYGLSAKEAGAGSGQFTYAYGVNFDRMNLVTFTSFVDRDGNGRKSGSTEVLEIHTIERGNSILKFCTVSAGGAEQCSDTGAIQQLNIAFLRPDPKALIRTGGTQTFPRARIYVASPRGNQKTITVESTGQISIQ